MKTTHKVGKLFSYGNCLGILHGIAESIGVAQIRIQVDMHGTRIAVLHGLLFSLIKYVIYYLLFYLSSYFTN